MSDTSIPGGRIRSFVERIEHLDTELQELNEQKKEVFAEAKAEGFDVKILKEIIKLRKQDKDEHDERENLLDLYMRAWKQPPRPPRPLDPTVLSKSPGPRSPRPSFLRITGSASQNFFGAPETPTASRATAIFHMRVSHHEGDLLARFDGKDALIHLLAKLTHVVISQTIDLEAPDNAGRYPLAYVVTSQLKPLNSSCLAPFNIPP